MKTIASLTVLLSSTLFYGADVAEAQSRWLRQFVFQRPVVTQSAITYGGFSHIDDLAVQMEQLAREICWEMHFNYTHNPGYAVTYAEAYEMLRKAKYIHQEEHHGHRGEIARTVGELDLLFHHVEDDIGNWRPSHRHFVGSGSLFDKMERFEVTLHHLMQDVGVTSTITDPPPPSVNVDPPLPSQSVQPAISVFNLR